MGYKIIQNCIFFLEDDKLQNVNIQTGFELWHYTLPEGLKIFGSVQAIDDVLFFRATDSNLDHSKNIGLKVTTGEVVWELENTMYFQIDYKNKGLRGYSGAYYQVVDPFTGTLLVNTFFEENWNNGIHPSSHDNAITTDKLWFVSGREESTKFGAIDLATSSIDFIQDFPLENGVQLDKPVYHQDKLYLRATNNVLYVLET